MKLFKRVLKALSRRYSQYVGKPVINFITKTWIKPVYYTTGNESAISLNNWFMQKVLGYNKTCYWPVHFTSKVIGWDNIYVGIDAAPGISSNCYIDGSNGIFVDDYAQIAPNVRLLSAHEHKGAKIVIGKYCRIGMGTVINPGVVLGDFTTVSAGSVVSTSFPNGYCVIGGSPATILIDYSNNESIKEKFIKYRNTYEYNGYIRSDVFEEFRKKYLKI